MDIGEILKGAAGVVFDRQNLHRNEMLRLGHLYRYTARPLSSFDLGEESIAGHSLNIEKIDLPTHCSWM